MGVKTRTIANNLTTGLGQGDWVKLSAANSQADVSEINLTLSTDYQIFKLVIASLCPATDGAKFRLRFSVDGGSSYLANTSNYSWIVDGVAGSSGSYTEHNSKATDYAGITKSTIGNNFQNEGMAGILTIIPNRSGYTTNRGNFYEFVGHRQDTGNAFRGLQSMGVTHSDANDVDAVKLYMDTGNIDQYTYTLYGAKN